MLYLNHKYSQCSFLCTHSALERMLAWLQMFHCSYRRAHSLTTVVLQFYYLSWWWERERESLLWLSMRYWRIMEACLSVYMGADVESLHQANVTSNQLWANKHIIIIITLLLSSGFVTYIFIFVSLLHTYIIIYQWMSQFQYRVNRNTYLTNNCQTRPDMWNKKL